MDLILVGKVLVLIAVIYGVRRAFVRRASSSLLRNRAAVVPRPLPPPSLSPRSLSPRPSTPDRIPAADVRATNGAAAGIEITEQFSKVLTIVRQGRNGLFITGRAGTGKSTLLKCLLKEIAGRAVVLAPTGLAAVNVSGQTIHSFFKFPPRLIQRQNIRVSRHAALYRNLNTIVIDEVSMVRADLMDGIDYFLRINRDKHDEPFGGVRVILIGDIHQLPPVVPEIELQRYLDHTYGGAFFFHAPVFKEMSLGYLELTKKFRQRDANFCSALDALAEGQCTREHFALLNRNLIELDSLPQKEQYVILAPRNQTVFDLNMQRLAALPSPVRIFTAEVRGQFDESSFPTEHTLGLKVGAKVVLLRNDQFKRWVNGTMATVSRLAEDKVWLLVSSTEHEIEREVWEKIRYDFDPAKRKIVQTVVGSFRQFPVRLAWALTIHKSQGMTLDRVYLDLARGAFVHGQTYVALSRCRSVDGLALARELRPDDVIFDRTALGYRDIFHPVS